MGKRGKCFCTNINFRVRLSGSKRIQDLCSNLAPSVALNELML